MKRIMKIIRSSSPHLVVLPTVPMQEVGEPAARSLLGWRSYRASYDWKAYDHRQLAVMERYWDDCIGVYQSLLPQRFRNSPGSFRGLNLGTFNGAFQKAWMRRGYNMYGIEITDVVDELREYGCEGQRGDFFCLSDIDDDEFDFAVMDRAFFLKVEHGYELDNHTGRYVERAAGIKKAIQSNGSRVQTSVPPFFSEVFRVLKNDGAFLGILYPNWSSAALKELYDQGGVQIWPVKRARPYLAICVDRQQSPTRFPGIEELLAGIKGLQSADAADALRASRYTWNVMEMEEPNCIKFHFLPTNMIVVLDLEKKQVLSAEVVVNDPSAEEFFQGGGNVFSIGESVGLPERSLVVSLVDTNLVGRLGENNSILKALSEVSPILSNDNLRKGGLSLVPAWRGIRRVFADRVDLKEVTVLVGNVPRDAVIRERSGRPYVSVQKSMKAVEAVLSEVAQLGGRALVILPPDARNPQWPGAQSDAISEYRKALSAVAADFAGVAIDVSIADSTAAQAQSYASLLSSKKVRAAVFEAVRAAIGPKPSHLTT